MTDLVFLLLIFFIIISTAVDTSHNIELPDGSGDPSLTSPVKIYVDGKNKFYINNNSTPINVDNIANEMNKVLGENKR